MMKLSPRLYHWMVRPGWLTDNYLNMHIRANFDFANKMVLDFGCGIGSSCPLFDPNNYLGLDPDKQRIEYARHLYPRYRFRVLKEGLNLSNAFDYILMIAVLHHIPSDALSHHLRQFRSWLRPNARIIVLEPCFLPGSYFNNNYMRLVDNGKYIRYPEEYIGMFSHHNYRIETVKTFKKLVLYNEILFSAVQDSPSFAP